MDNLIVFIAMQRTGTSALHRALSMSGKFSACYEVMFPIKPETVVPNGVDENVFFTANFFQWYKRFEKAPENWEEVLEQYFCFLSSAFDRRFVSLDFKYDQIAKLERFLSIPTDGLINFLIRKNIPIIHIVRKNAVARYLSNQVMNSVKKASYLAGEKIPGSTTLHIDLKKCEADVAGYLAKVLYVRRVIAGMKNTCEVTYENMYSDGVVSSRVVDFLNQALGASIASLKTDNVPTPVNYHEVVANTQDLISRSPDFEFRKMVHELLPEGYKEMKEIMNDLHMEGQLDVELAPVLQRMQDRIMKQTHYHGVITHKQPLDFWVYQEMIYEQKPDVIIEIGNCYGGSTLALAHQLDLLDHGRIIAVDIDHSKVHEKARAHARIEWIESCALAAFDEIKGKVKKGEKVLIIEDSAHTYKHTLKVLRLYGQLLSIGEYIIVEDGIGRHGLQFGDSPGPYESVTQFLSENDNFIADREKESFFITWNPQGYVKRVK